MPISFTLSSKETRNVLGDLESLAGSCICGPKEVPPEGAKACPFCRICKPSLQSIQRGAVSGLSAGGARLRRTPSAWATRAPRSTTCPGARPSFGVRMQPSRTGKGRQKCRRNLISVYPLEFLLCSHIMATIRSYNGEPGLDCSS